MRGTVRQARTSHRGAELNSHDGLAIGLVSPLPPQHGGVATVARWLLNNQQAIGARYVTFNLMRPTDELGGRLRVASLTYQVRQLRQFVPWAKRSPRIIHYALALSPIGLARDFVYLLILATYGRKVIVHIHAVAPQKPWWRPAMRAIRRLAAEIVTLGQAAHRDLDAVGISSRVVPNAFPLDPQLVDAYRCPDGVKPFQLLFVGAVGVDKGCFELVDALGAVRKAGIDCRIDFVGLPAFKGEQERLDTYVSALGLGSAVRFLGPREPEELPALYAQSHAFCLPSHMEGLPLSLIEAMAYGLPVVATLVGCVGDLVIHGKTGLLARVGDPASLSEQLSLLARDPNLRHELGENGARHVAIRMGTNVIATAWHEIYSSLA
jgi:glycosyltransferase involved in cell wall biosynthesis